MWNTVFSDKKMVLIQIKINQVLRVLEICGTFTSTWPPESTAGKREIFLRDLGWTLAILNVLGSLAPLFLGAWHSENVIRLMKALSELTALLEVLFNLILCRIGRSRLQVRFCHLLLHKNCFLNLTRSFQLILWCWSQI